MMREKLLVVLGPTASGKTGLSIELAKALNTEIISGDSMLVYRGFDIGSAKPDMAERQGIVHHMIDVRDPWESFSVADFINEVKPIISGINSQGKIPILCGGTGLYIKSLLEGYEFNQTSDDREYREHLEKLAEEKGREYIFDMLRQVNPEAADRLHVNNFRRVIRALEVYHLGGEQLSTKRRSATDDSDVVTEENELMYDCLAVGIQWERPLLYERINRRVDIMVEQGLEKEVRSLLDRGISPDSQPMKSIGYKEMAAYINNQISLEQSVSDIKKNTRHFAKRQITWYRKMPYIKWYSGVEQEKHSLLQEILQHKFLRDY